MKNKYFLGLAFGLGLAAAGTSIAQTPATQPKPQGPAPTTTGGNVPNGKVAVIFSAAFQDPKQGIARFGVLFNKLNGEFQKTQDDLTQMAKTIQTLQDEVAKLQQSAAPVDPKTVQAKVDQIDQMKKEYQRKGEDGQAAYQRRRTEIFGPLQDDVGKALDAYAKARGIMLVIDGSQVEGVLYAAETIDITRAFISDYNSKNPATAAVTPPKP
jgi:outer membrane protein